MYAQTNAPYPNRLQLVLTPFLGPLAQDGPLGEFDPRRDLRVYVDGVLTPVLTFSFDAPNNRYLLYMSGAFDLQGVVQVSYHMPSPPFADAGANVVPGFTQVASYSTAPDVVVSQMALSAVPATAIFEAGSPPDIMPSAVTLLWGTVGVAKVEIVSPPFSTGFVGPSGIYVFPLAGQAPGIVVFTMTGYDIFNSPIMAGSPPGPLTATATVTITESSESFFLQEDGTFKFLLEGGAGYFILET